MLTPASLDLKSYYFIKVDVSVDMDTFLSKDPELKAEDLYSKIYVHRDSEHDEELLVRLIITTDSPDDEQIDPTVVHVYVEMLGRFFIPKELKGKLDEGKVKEETVVINAVSILYSAIREQVVSLTAKMPVGPIYLPTSSFTIEKSKNLASGPKPAPAMPKKTVKPRAKKPA